MTVWADLNTDGLAALSLSTYAFDMEKKPQVAAPLPVLPLNGPTIAVNIAAAQFIPGNGSIQLQVAEVRDAAVERVGDLPRQALHEIGRFVLTPRALRQLLDSTVVAIKAYEDNVGTIPTQDQYIARAAMTGLIPPPDPPKSD